jgi:hypothetical protein
MCVVRASPDVNAGWAIPLSLTERVAVAVTNSVFVAVKVLPPLYREVGSIDMVLCRKSASLDYMKRI